MISLASMLLYFGYLFIYAAVQGGDLVRNPLQAAWPTP